MPYYGTWIKRMFVFQSVMHDFVLMTVHVHTVYWRPMVHRFHFYCVFGRTQVHHVFEHVIDSTSLWSSLFLFYHNIEILFCMQWQCCDTPCSCGFWSRLWNPKICLLILGSVCPPGQPVSWHDTFMVLIEPDLSLETSAEDITHSNKLFTCFMSCRI